MTRGSSPTLIGRTADLERLLACIPAARTGDRPVVLVSGEAGIGKSRLLAEFETSAIAASPVGRPARFLHGSCVEVGEHLSYLPVLDWFDELSRVDDAERPDVTALLAALGGTHDGRAGDVGEAGDAVRDPGTSRSAHFQQLRELLVTLADGSDVVAVIDDLHWADRSTLDVVAFLARRLVGTGVLLVLAYRSDELHRRHPLTPVVAELVRRSVLEHIRLEPLAPDEVGAQIAEIVGHPVESARAGRVVELADGNPFHVEELLALEGTTSLPSTLRDVIGARLDAIDDNTLAIVREAAIIGRRVDAGLLAAVSRTAESATNDGLRAAVEARILVSDSDGRRYRFRHALLREAVYDEILPSERVDAHGRIAEALVAHPAFGDPIPSVAAADRARHWLGAHAEPEAFLALIDAGRAAWSAGAMAEGRRAFEEALALWDRVPDPGAADIPRSRLLQGAAAMAWYEGDTRRALDLNLRTQVEPDVQSDPWRLGRLIDHEAWYHSEMHDFEIALATSRRAIEVIPSEPPTAELAVAVGTLGAHESAAGRMFEARSILDRALSIARAADSWSAVTANSAFLAFVHADLGEEDLAETAIHEAWASLERDIVDDSFFAVTTNASWVWLALGRYDRAIEDADRALQMSEQRGVEAGGGAWYTAPRADALYRSGRWDEALATVASATAYAFAQSPEVYHRAVVARIRAGRGDFAQARRDAAASGEAARVAAFDESSAFRMAVAWVELLAGEPTVAADALRPSMADLAVVNGLASRAEVVAMIAWVAAEVAARARTEPDADRADDLATVVLELEPTLRAPGQTRDGIDPWLDVARAWSARRDDRDEPGDWSVAAAGFERIGARPMAAIARQGELEAILRTGGPSAAARQAHSASLAHIEAVGASALRDRLERVARAARLGAPSESGPSVRPDAIDDPVGPPPDPWGLSPREREVLELLIDGRTNAQIGAALFISDKTASVHVTHILDKLGVSSRVEAALAAVRAGLGSTDTMADRP